MILLDWFEFAAAYYIWDLITSIYTAYGLAFVFHGLLSFPVFLFSAIGPQHFLRGFYGRFYHGVFALSTPWMHIRELIVVSKKQTIFKLVCEVLFVISYTIVRVVLGTLISYRFISEMVGMLMNNPGKVHSRFVFLVSILACSVITFLQLYWFALEIVPAVMDTLRGAPTKQD